MSADDNDQRHLTAARAVLAATTERLAKHILANQQLVADNDRMRQAIDAAVEELENAHVMNSQDAGPVVCASVAHDIASALRAARSKP